MSYYICLLQKSHLVRYDARNNLIRLGIIDNDKSYRTQFETYNTNHSIHMPVVLL